MEARNMSLAQDDDTDTTIAMDRNQRIGGKYGRGGRAQRREDVMAAYVRATFARNILPSIGDILGLVLQFHSSHQRASAARDVSVTTVESVEAEKDAKHSLRFVADILHSVLTFGRIRNNGAMETTAFGMYRRFTSSDFMMKNPDLRHLFDNMVASRITRFIFHMCKARKGYSAEEAYMVLRKWRSHAANERLNPSLPIHPMPGQASDQGDTALHKNGMSIDLITFNALLDGSLARNRIQFAERIIEQGKQEFGLSPNLETFHIILRHLLHAGNFTRAHWILEQMLRANGMVEDDFVLFGKSSQETSRQKKQQQREEEEEEHQVEMTHEKEDQEEKSEIHDVEEHNEQSDTDSETVDSLSIPVTETSIPKPSTATLLLFIRHHLSNQTSERSIDAVDDLLDLMSQLDMKPNIELWNTLLEHMIRSKQLDKARELSEELQQWTKADAEESIEPNPRTYSLLDLLDMESMKQGETQDMT